MRFEKVSRWNDVDFKMPCRKTEHSAGYDMVVVEDIIVPSYLKIVSEHGNERINFNEPKTLSEAKSYYKVRKSLKPTLVSTGVKCKLDPGYYLELSVRSSTPLNSWLMLANSVGIIDADYYNNIDNEGEIYFQLVNFSPFDIHLMPGDVVGQGIIKKYHTAEEQKVTATRAGGFGSTDIGISNSTPNSIDVNLNFKQDFLDSFLYNQILPMDEGYTQTNAISDKEIFNKPIECGNIQIDFGAINEMGISAEEAIKSIQEAISKNSFLNGYENR